MTWLAPGTTSGRCTSSSDVSMREGHCSRRRRGSSARLWDRAIRRSRSRSTTSRWRRGGRATWPGPRPRSPRQPRSWASRSRPITRWRSPAASPRTLPRNPDDQPGRHALRIPGCGTAVASPHGSVRAGPGKLGVPSWSSWALVWGRCRMDENTHRSSMMILHVGVGDHVSQPGGVGGVDERPERGGGVWSLVSEVRPVARDWGAAGDFYDRRVAWPDA
jgi:hypothetical protein